MHDTTLVCGLLFALTAFNYGIDNFRNEIINKSSDIYVGKWFNICIMFFPVLFSIVIGWSFYQTIITQPDSWWNPFYANSVGTVILQVGISCLVFKLLNNKLANWIHPSDSADIEILKKSKNSIDCVTKNSILTVVEEN
jgi:neurotransmitter:Na+ symporter, NSS family